MVFAWLLPSAVAIAAASEPGPVALVLVTINVASRRRSSSAIKAGRGRLRCGRRSLALGRIIVVSLLGEEPSVSRHRESPRGAPPSPADPAAPRIGPAGPRSDAGTSASA